MACPACGQRYPWRDRLSRRKLRCICGAKFRMPADASQAPTLLEDIPVQPTTERPRPGDGTRTEPPPQPVTSSASAEELDTTGGYALAALDSDDEPVPPAQPAALTAPSLPKQPTPTAEDAEAVVCPSCERQLRPGLKICISCGIDVRSGRSIITSQQVDENVVHGNAEPVIRVVSFALPFGLYPLASEAFGTRTPWTIRTVALLTLLVSFWFLVYLWTGAEGLQSHKSLMLWPQGEATATHVREMYLFTPYGDFDALLAEIDAIHLRQARADAAAGDTTAGDAGEVGHGAEALTEEQQFQAMLSELLGSGALADASNETILEAHGNLPPRARAIGEFRWYQLLTHALLHGGILHLAGNMLFLLVFGLRVNALVGNLGTALLYPVLAVAAGVAHMVGTAGEPPIPMLGASGAIWGLAGMYLVLFPVHRVYNALWFRWPVFPLVLLMRLHMKIFACRGCWIVLFFISFDVLAVVMGWHGATAHWAHLGGFLAGVAIALGLLTTRVVDAGGGDVLSVSLGKWAWFLIGSPAQRASRRAPAA